MTYQAANADDKTMAETIARAKRGDREAFGVIFEHHHRFIYKFVYAMVGDHSRAEEMTQETFLGAYRGIASMRGDASLKTWLCAIAKNLVYKSLRDGRAEREKKDDAETVELADNRGLSPAEEVLNKELNQAIAEALTRLNADRRLIFVLKEMQNLSYKEISEVTGNAIPKLKTDLFRAKNEMRELLRPYLEVRK